MKATMNLGVGILDKVRVYELAKDLNTTSKRLTEKLAEINIFVKNHMSLLSDEELKALYNHIGIINQDAAKRAENEERKSGPVQQAGAELKDKQIKKDAKQAPRIIRKTEIIIDSRNEIRDESKANASNMPNMQRNEFRNDGRRNEFKNDNRNLRQGMVRHEEANSGLRSGFVRSTGMDFKKDVKRPPVRESNKESAMASTPVNMETKHETKVEIKPETNTETRFETKEAAKHEEKAGEIKETRIEKAAEAGVTDKTDEKNLKPGESREDFHKKDEEAKRQDENRSFNRHRNTENIEARPGTDRNQGRTQYNGQRNDNRKWQNNNARPDNRPGDGRTNNRPDNRPDGRTNSRPDNRPGDGRINNRPDGRTNSRPDNRPADGRTNSRPDGRTNNVNRSFGQQGRPHTSSQGPGAQGFGNRQNSRHNDKPGHLEIPKPEMTDAQKEEINSLRNEVKREYQGKDADKDSKRELRKDLLKGQGANKNQRFKPQKVNLGEKKGVTEALSEDYILEEFYDDEGVKRTKKSFRPRKDIRNIGETRHIPHRAVLTLVKIGESITVKDLAETLKKTATEVIKKLMAFGVMATLNHEVDFDTASIVAEEFGIKTEKEVVVNEEDILFDDSEDEEESKLQPRPPVVVVMGHVDHGKTSLLDAIRETNVIESEAGGITQHIGAYTVKINNRNITFLDTPGHEAFTAMRARGAQVTDIAILVVAADDGVMPQTIEAINHAKAANVSIIVAINKMDKPGANPDKVKQELTEYGLVPEEWGGDVICVNVSAKKRENIDHLLEMVLLAADVLELKANPDKQAKGTVIEAKLDKDRGPIATILVQRGTLKLGDSIVTGTTVGRIRAMTDDKGHSAKKAGPSTPVEILGLPEVPEAGEIFYAITDEKVAKQLAEKRKMKQREQQLKSSAKVSLDDLFNQIKEGKVKELNIIVKADVQGSVEAVKQSLEKLSNDEVRVNIIHGGVGAVAEADVTLAQVSNAIIIGFNVRPGANVIEAAKNAGVDMRLYRVIYNAIEDIEAAMKGMLDPTFKEVVQGHAEIRQIFKVSGIGTIAGCYVTDGKITRNSETRVIRNGIVVYEGKLASLKRFKDDAKEVAQGFECGLSLERFNDIKEGDVMESYVMEEVER